MNTHRNGGRQLHTASLEAVPTLAFAAFGGMLGAIVLLLWITLGWWSLVLPASVLGAGMLAKVLARLELKRMTRKLEYQRRTRWEAGVGQHVDVEA